MGSILPTFYLQLLHTQIPKAQKDSQLKYHFPLLGSAGVKAACKHVDEIDPRAAVFYQHFTSSFCASFKLFSQNFISQKCAKVQQREQLQKKHKSKTM